ncbi:MAG: L-threonylcarbamoyladenylate synthase [Patescibacteria group bacterium]
MTDIIIYPTDTAYALGCDARVGEAVERIFAIKGRDQGKALPLIAADINMVREWCELSGQAAELAEKYWPGPLTLVLPVKKSGLAAAVIAEGAVAIRVPDQKEARALARRLGGPIVSTSANKAGGNNCYSLSEVRTSLGEASNRVGRIIDIGELPQRPVSTIVKVCDNKIIVIREGAVKI